MHSNPLPTVAELVAELRLISRSGDAVGSGIWIVANAAAIADRLEAGEKFKKWVHDYLDGKGIPTHPDGPHSKEGCRIGDRMDMVFARLAAAEKRVAVLTIERKNIYDGREVAERKLTAAESRLESKTAMCEMLIGQRDSLQSDLDEIQQDRTLNNPPQDEGDNPKPSSPDVNEIIDRWSSMDQFLFSKRYPDSWIDHARKDIANLLKWFGTEQSMHTAWRKLAEESESRLARAERIEAAAHSYLTVDTIHKPYCKSFQKGAPVTGDCDCGRWEKTRVLSAALAEPKEASDA